MVSPDTRERKAGSHPQADIALARRIKEVASTAEGVARIGEGRLIEVATRWLEEKVVGVAVEEDRIELHVVAEYPSGFPVAALVERLRNALESLCEGRRLDIVIDDLVVTEDDETG